MGYVDKKSPVLLGLGPTSISDSGRSFIQNAKDLKRYQQLISENKLPIETGHVQQELDLRVQKIILQLMCDEQVELGAWQRLPHYPQIREELEQFQRDGVLSFDPEWLRILPNGKGFVRNVAMSFDFHLREQKTRVKFSQTI